MSDYNQLDKEALDRWITREPDDDDSENNDDSDDSEENEEGEE
jgi:hypothetical protein